jgi:hypothetical protein
MKFSKLVPSEQEYNYYMYTLKTNIGIVFITSTFWILFFVKVHVLYIETDALGVGIDTTIHI